MKKISWFQEKIKSRQSSIVSGQSNTNEDAFNHEQVPHDSSVQDKAYANVPDTQFIIEEPQNVKNS